MHQPDFAAFGQLLDTVCRALSRGSYVPSAEDTALFFRALAAYDLATVRAALDAHVRDSQRGRFVPTPADVIAQIEHAIAADGRPGAEEAWAIAVRGVDENVTVVWTEETAQAWQICRPVFDLGDEVGARVAFREAYNRLVVEARMAHRKPVWTEALGFDPELRIQAVRHAIALGRLEPAQLPLLEAPRDPNGGLQKLLASPSMPERTRLELQQVRDRLTGKAPMPDKLPPAVAMTRELQAQTQAKVDGYLAGADSDPSTSPDHGDQS